MRPTKPWKDDIGFLTGWRRVFIHAIFRGEKSMKGDRLPTLGFNRWTRKLEGKGVDDREGNDVTGWERRSYSGMLNFSISLRMAISAKEGTTSHVTFSITSFAIRATTSATIFSVMALT